MRRNIYKHIHAVEVHAIPRNSRVGTVVAVLKLMADSMCPRCRTAARRDGVRRNWCSDKQRYLCTECGLRFSAGLGFEWRGYRLP